MTSDLQKSVLLFLLLLLMGSCGKKEEDKYAWKTLEVVATAYNSLEYQTSSNPHITAFGDSLIPGRNYIAVSRDLIKLGLTHDTPVKIEGFDSVYLVKDKMHPRWRRHIDIYMGTDVKEAMKWGRQKVLIEYRIPIDDATSND